MKRLTSAWIFCMACDPAHPCDPGQTERNGSCFEVAQQQERDAEAPQNDAGGADRDASAPAGNDECAEDPFKTFGKGCESDADCACKADICAPTLNTCTAFNCLDDPGVCPDGSTCMDISQFSSDPNFGSICL
jgi:hypothetical protein